MYVHVRYPPHGAQGRAATTREGHRVRGPPALRGVVGGGGGKAKGGDNVRFS